MGKKRKERGKEESEEGREKGKGGREGGREERREEGKKERKYILFCFQHYYSFLYLSRESSTIVSKK
jgi:hypothetical protein